MNKKSREEEISERRAKRKQNIGTNTNSHISSKAKNESIYMNGNINQSKRKEVSKSKVNRNRKNKKRTKNKSFKGYIIVLIIAILILLAVILNGNKKEDVSKFFYLNNQKIVTQKPIRISLAQNSTAKVVIMSLEDIVANFDKDISYNEDTNEIITTGDTHVARIILNDYGINLNGTDSVINVSAFKDEDIIYLPLNDLSSVYGVEVFVTNNNKVIVDNIHKGKKVVRVVEDTKLKKSKMFLSKSLEKLSGDKDYVLVEEGKNKYKLRTSNGTYGYVSKNKVKSIIEVRSDYIEDEEIEYNFIRNYRIPEDNFDNVNVEDTNKVAIIELFNITEKNNILSLEEKYSKENPSYIIFIDKLKTNNIEIVAELNLEKYNLNDYLEDFTKRQVFISQLLKIANNHNIQGIELLANEDISSKVYETFIRELKPRLKERGLKLFTSN